METVRNYRGCPGFTVVVEIDYQVSIFWTDILCRGGTADSYVCFFHPKADHECTPVTADTALEDLARLCANGDCHTTGNGSGHREHSVL